MSPTSGQMWYPPHNKFLDCQQDQFFHRQGQLDQVQTREFQRSKSRRLIDDTLRINKNYNNRNLDILLGNVATSIYKLTRTNEISYLCVGILQLIVQEKNLNHKTWSKCTDQGRNTNVKKIQSCEPLTDRSFADISLKKHCGIISTEKHCVTKKKSKNKGSMKESKQNEGEQNVDFTGNTHPYRGVPGTSVQNQHIKGTPRQNQGGRNVSFKGIPRHNHIVSDNPGKKKVYQTNLDKIKVKKEKQDKISASQVP